MADKKAFDFSFEFIEPAEVVMAAARKFVASPDENNRCVAKALLDSREAGFAIKKALGEGRDVDLAPYFDFWFADAITCANKLLHSENNEARYLADCLIRTEKAILKSKESFLAEMKRLGVKPSAG